MDAALSQAILQRLATLSSPERPIYLVGGAVRDVFMQRQPHDLDFVLPGPTRQVARQIADAFDGGFYVLDEERDTSRVVLQPPVGPRTLLDFASVRAADLEGDLRSRDFTINAMAYDVAHPEDLIDPLGGLQDLRAGLIRACSPASLEQDPARVLRAVRQALSLNFRIDPDTLRQVQAAAPLLSRISPERQRDELFRILAGRRVSQAVQILDHLGALVMVLPELQLLKGVKQSPPHVADVWEHTLGVVRHLEHLFEALVGDYHEDTGADLNTGLAVLRLGRFRASFDRHFAAVEPHPDRPSKALLFFAALYHDIAKPITRTVDSGGIHAGGSGEAQSQAKIRFLGHPERGAEMTAHRGRALALSGEEVQRVAKIVRQHMRVHFLAGSLDPKEADLAVKAPARRSIYRYFRDTGEAGVDICLLSLADMRATYETSLKPDAWLAELDTCRALLESYWEDSAAVVSPPRFLTGSDIITLFGMKPGPEIGRLLEAVREGQAAGEIHSREDALDFARRWIESPEKSKQEEEG